MACVSYISVSAKFFWRTAKQKIKTKLAAQPFSNIFFLRHTKLTIHVAFYIVTDYIKITV